MSCFIRFKFYFQGLNSNLNVNMDMNSIKEPQSRLRKWTTVDSISVNTSLDQNSSKHGINYTLWFLLKKKMWGGYGGKFAYWLSVFTTKLDSQSSDLRPHDKKRAYLLLQLVL